MPPTRVGEPKQTEHEGKVVTGGTCTPHKLPGVSGSLPGTAGFAKHSHSMMIQMKMDNVTAVTHIKKLCRRPTLFPIVSITPTIWEWSLQRNIFLHLPGKDNVAADQESRLMKDYTAIP